MGTIKLIKDRLRHPWFIFVCRFFPFKLTVFYNPYSKWSSVIKSIKNNPIHNSKSQNAAMQDFGLSEESKILFLLLESLKAQNALWYWFNIFPSQIRLASVKSESPFNNLVLRIVWQVLQIKMLGTFFLFWVFWGVFWHLETIVSNKCKVNNPGDLLTVLEKIFVTWSLLDSCITVTYIRVRHMGPNTERTAVPSTSIGFTSNSRCKHFAKLGL